MKHNYTQQQTNLDKPSAWPFPWVVAIFVLGCLTHNGAAICRTRKKNLKKLRYSVKSGGAKDNPQDQAPPSLNCHFQNCKLTEFRGGGVRFDTQKRTKLNIT